MGHDHPVSWQQAQGPRLRDRDARQVGRFPGVDLGRDHLQSSLERSFWGPASTTLGAWNCHEIHP